MPIHPATKILLWVGAALMVQGLGLIPLALTTALVIFALFFLRGFSSAMIMLHRARWLLLPLLLIYAYATPGMPIFPAVGAISPSLDGLLNGTLQAWRLVLLLLGLALLLLTCPHESLLGGLYTLMRPFRIMGLDPERIAVRLWLTMRYAQERSHQQKRNWRNELRAALNPAPGVASMVRLEVFAFSWRDTAVLTLAACFTGLAQWPGLLS